MFLQGPGAEWSMREQSVQTYHIILFIRNIRNRQIHEYRKQINGCQGQRVVWEEWAFLANGYRIFCWDDENVLELDGDDGCTAS